MTDHEQVPTEPPSPESPEDGSPTSATQPRIGVALPALGALLGPWISAARAFDTARAHSLWIASDLSDIASSTEDEAHPNGSPGRDDPLLLTAALAAATRRALLVTALLPHQRRGPKPSLATTNALSTLSGMSAERTALLAHPGDSADGYSLPVFTPVPDPKDSSRTAYTAQPGAGHGELWVSVPLPADRKEWRETLRDASDRGADGVVVPADPRLVDLLRSPHGHGRRHDLRTAVG